MDLNSLCTLVWTATLQTLAMVFASTFFSLVLGLPLGVLLCVTDPAGGILPRPVFNQILTRIVNALRSFPFLILFHTQVQFFRNLVKEIGAAVVLTSFDGGISVITLAVLDVQSEYPGEKG